jgi:hypothetical protein
MRCANPGIAAISLIVRDIGQLAREPSAVETPLPWINIQDDGCTGVNPLEIP